jgi:hypothetical protein
LILKHFIRISSLTIFIFAFLILTQNISAQTKRTVRFAAGASSATLRGRVSGYAYADYLVRANGGQTITVELGGNPVSPVFSIFQPSGDNLEGIMQSNDYTGTLPIAGVYVVRVGLMRALARRKQSSNFTLKIAVN